MSPSMQKIAIVFVFLFSVACLFAQEGAYSQRSDSEELDLYYYNVPIVRIYYHQRGYYVLYRTSDNGIAKMCVPLEWMKVGDTRAMYNTVRAGVAPYFSYITNNGEFFQLRINVSTDKGDLTWGGIISKDKVPDESFDIETVDIYF